MRLFSRQVKIACLAGTSLLLAVGAAFASHGKVGLWSITVMIGGDVPNMPDMSKLPPEAQARMKAMGMTMGGRTVTAQHCMSAAEVASDVPKISAGSANGCTVENVQHSGRSLSADLSCANSTFKGTGHVQFAFDTDTHYSGELKLAGVANGHPLHEDEKLEGHWLSANCGSIAN